MIRSSTVSQIVRLFVIATALAGGAMGCGGGSESTGGTGGAGGGAGGSTGAGGTCDAMPIFTKHTCTVVGACHDTNGSAAGFDMLTAGWETHLVGEAVSGGGTGTLASLCGGMGLVYLKPNIIPAQGLFIDKLTKSPPECGVAMPNLPPLLNDTEKACVQSWANGLVNAAK
jgi:hypothetical protein